MVSRRCEGYDGTRVRLFVACSVVVSVDPDRGRRQCMPPGIVVVDAVVCVQYSSIEDFSFSVTPIEDERV